MGWWLMADGLAVRLYAPTTEASDGSYVYPVVTKGAAILA